MIRTLLIGAAVVLTASLAGLPAAEAAKSRNCGPAVEQRLKDLGVAQSNVHRILIETRIRNRRSGSKVIGYDAWISLKSCSDGNSEG